MSTIFKGVTIDPAGAVDLDDAIWIDRKGADWVARIAFPRLAKHVKVDGGADVVARQRLFTNYFADGAKHMLPEGTMTYGSLTPGSSKSVFEVVIVLNRAFRPVDVQVRKAQFFSRQRLSYDEASELVREGEGLISDMLRQARDLARGLFENRRASGAIAFYDLEKGIAFDEEGAVILMTGEGHVAEMIVREFMILANACLAAFAAEARIPLLYRNHHAQGEATRSSVLAQLEGMVDAQAADVQVGGMPRLMARARLGVEAKGHYGLNLPAYAWFTSPLRRYADLVNQRMIEAHLDGTTAPYDAETLASLAEAINARHDELLDRRSAGYRARSERRADRMIAGGAIATELDFRRVVRAASADPSKVNDVVVEESLRRIGSEDLSAKEMARLLMMDPRTGAAVVARMKADPTIGPSVLNYGVAAMGWNEPVFEESRAGPPHAPVFVSKGRLEVAGVEHASPPVVRPTRKAAQHSAIVHLLASIAGQDMPPEAEAPVQVGEVDQSGKAPRPGKAPPSNQNPRSRLQEYCAKRKLPLPTFHVSESGPPNDPTFEAMAIVRIEGKDVASPPASGRTRKDAEKAAATALLVTMGVEAGSARPSETAKSGPAAPKVASKPARPAAGIVDPAVRTKLETLCARRRWSRPSFDVRSSGPSHMPTFEATASVDAGGRQLRTEVFTAGSRKDAERGAAAALLAMAERSAAGSR